MKIQSLWVEKFKNLDDFEIDFSKNHRICAVVGINGSGKSNLFECLCSIFSDLDRCTSGSIIAPGFDYKLQYEIRGHRISIEAGPSKKPRYSFEVDGKKYSNKKFFETKDFLPDHLFAYYSGESKRLEKYFVKSQERFDKELRENTDRPLRRMFFARPIHGYFVLLAFFLDKKENTLTSMMENPKYLGIEGLDSVLFALKEPQWAKDGYFWSAKGKVSEFLEKLWANSLAPIKMPGKASLFRPNGFKKDESVEKIFLYLKDEHSFHELVESDPPQEFFKKLESTYIADLLDYVDVRVRLANCQECLTYRELSEGEQQLLAVLGLLKFTQEEESLFLLDEPDTHLNPNWSREYINLLREIMGEDNQSQILISSHDPVVLSELNQEQVVLLNRVEGKVKQTELEDRVKGKGYGGVLVGELFDLPSQLDTETHEKVMEYYRILALQKVGDISDYQNMKLKELKADLDSIGYWLEHSDPLFSEYLKARHDFWQDLDQTPDSEIRREKALEVIKKVYSS